MKRTAWLGIAILVFSVALLPGVEQAFASPEQVEAGSIQANARWFTDYIEQTGGVGTHASIAFDPGDGAPWIRLLRCGEHCLEGGSLPGQRGQLRTG